jgi:hypothetical protein
MDIAKFLSRQLELLEREKQCEVDEVRFLCPHSWILYLLMKMNECHRAYSPKDLQKFGVALLNMGVTGIFWILSR